jgi:hypothetical protein
MQVLSASLFIFSYWTQEPAAATPRTAATMP